MSDYGSVPGVAAFVRHMTFDAPNNPTTIDIQSFLIQQSAKINGWLSRAGYAIPVTTTTAKAVLDNFVNLGAAGLAELTQRSAGYDPNTDDARERTFLAEFERAEAFINSGALAAMGVTQTLVGVLAANQPAIGLIAAGTSLDTTRRLPPEWRV